MLITIIVLQVLLGLVINLFIYRTYILGCNKRWVKLTYILQAIVCDVLLLASLLIAQSLMGTLPLMVYMLWVIYFFMLTFFTKFAFSLFVALRWLLRRFRPHRRYRGLTIAGLIVAASIFLTIIYGNVVGRRDIRVERVEIVSDRIPAAFDGFTIAQFSDTHIGNMGSQSELITQLVKSINELSPDVVVQSGDLVNIVSNELNDWYMDEFRKIEAPVYSVLGNHDLGFYIQNTETHPPHRSVEMLKAKQAQMGWKLLENDREFIKRGDDSIVIAGVTFPNDMGHNGTNSIEGGSNLKFATRGVNDSTYSILIAHTPKMFDSIVTIARPDLTLSGHMHSMQFKITIGDWFWSPAAWNYPLYSGLYERGRHKLYVNDGIGYVAFPMRIGAAPEITLFTLRRPH